MKAHSGRAHILHVIDSLSPGGAERMAIEIANATDKNHYEVGICVTRLDASLAGAAAPEVKLFCLGRKKTFDRAKLKEFRDYCIHERVDVLHVHGRSSFLLIAYMYARYPSMRRTGVLLHDHYGDIETNPNLSLKMRMGLRLVKPVYVGVHHKLAESALRIGLDANRVYTIRNALDLRPYQRRTTEIHCTQSAWGSRSRPYGVMIANIRPAKDILFFMDVLDKVKAEPWTVAIAGGLVDEAYAKACLALRDELGLHERVHFLGSRADIIELLGQADFAVLCSKTESGPLALIEYTAAGLPLVSTRVGLIGHYLDEKGVPEFVPPGDVQAMRGALRRLIQLSPGERKQRGERGREIARRDFDIRVVMPEWYQAYEAVLERRGG